MPLPVADNGLGWQSSGPPGLDNNDSALIR